MPEQTPGASPTVEDRPPSAPVRAWRAVRAWPTAARAALLTAVALVLLLVIGLLTAVVLLRRPLPPTAGALEVPGLRGEVSVLRDAQGVPHVYADTVDDLMLAQGWLTASERFFQMDVHRHAAHGRLAELFGEPAVDADALARTLGWARTAEQELGLVSPDTRAALASYAAGVNAYVEQRGTTELAADYALLGAGGLGYRPEPWSEVDSLAWLGTVGWEMGGGVDADVERALTVATVGRAGARTLYPEPAPLAGPVVGQGAVVDGVYEADAVRGGTRNPRRPAPFGATALPRPEPPRPDPLPAGLLTATARGLAAQPAWVARGAGRGSNAWAVAGDRSTTGAPILAGDPHLTASMPGVWLQVGLHCRTVTPACPYDVSGASLPGLPGVVMGHNADVAWAMTALGADVADLFVERLDGATYRSGGASLPLRTRQETIRVADGPDVVLDVRSTRHGPLLSDAFATYAELTGRTPVPGRGATGPDGTPWELGLAVRWTGLRPHRTADAILGLDTATGWEDVRTALADLALPAQGVVYADTAGHVGFQAAGEVPVRTSANDGSLPAAGWRPETDWTGRFVPPEGLPSVLDPDSGVVVAANQAVAPADYPYPLTTAPDPGYRAARIGEVLAEGPLSPEASAALQVDTLDPTAAVLVPRLAAVELPGGYDDDGQELLRDWDGRMDADSGAAAYFSATWQALLALTFHDELPPELWPHGGARWAQVVTDLLDRPRSPWWDDVETDERETRDDVLAAALLEARDDLTRLQAVDAGQWAWGRSHVLDLRGRPYGAWPAGPGAGLLADDGTGVGGGPLSVLATDWDAAAGARGWPVTTAPSLRMQVRLDDLDASRWVAPPGVSGHLTSEHRTDQLAPYAAGDLVPWASSASAVRAAAVDELVLRPPDDPAGDPADDPVSDPVP